MIIDTGKGEGPGASRAINPDHNPRDRNWDIKGNTSINRGLRFSTISNKDNSNKDNHRFRNLKGNHKEDPRLNNHNSNNINRRFSNPRDSRNPNNRDSNNPRFSNPNNSILNLRASNTREDHNPHILKESLKEEMQNTESRRLMSHLAAK
jgi:hypothetical protein